MANNRMVIVCKECKVGISIAKWYPSFGWGYSGDSEEQFARRARRLDGFFSRHREMEDHNCNDEYRFYLAFEGKGGDWTYERRDIGG